MSTASGPPAAEGPPAKQLTGPRFAGYIPNLTMDTRYRKKSRDGAESVSLTAFLARFNRLPETARFYSILSVLVLMLAVASGVVVDRSWM